jgi:hypothetical protein
LPCCNSPQFVVEPVEPAPHLGVDPVGLRIQLPKGLDEGHCDRLVGGSSARKEAEDHGQGRGYDRDKGDENLLTQSVALS